MIGIVLSLNSEKPAIQDVFREGRPNILDLILNKQVSLIINTPWAKRDAIADESAIRKEPRQFPTSVSKQFKGLQ